MRKKVLILIKTFSSVENIIRFETVDQYSSYNNHPTLHPLINIIDYSKSKPGNEKMMYLGLYSIVLKDIACGDIIYGKETYDYQNGTLVFFAPGQIVGYEGSSEDYQPMGIGLIFHPDLLHGTNLAEQIKEFHYFTYQSREALHLADNEREIVTDFFLNIQTELKNGHDLYSNKLIIAHLELLLNYILRFYDRQFDTRKEINSGILSDFEALLDHYFDSERPQTIGLPSVGWCADAMNLSANYFGDLIKKKTSYSAQEYIHRKIISVAKNKIFDPRKRLNEIAFEMGFGYPANFTRFFKHHTGLSPNEFRKTLMQ